MEYGGSASTDLFTNYLPLTFLLHQFLFVLSFKFRMSVDEGGNCHGQWQFPKFLLNELGLQIDGDILFRTTLFCCWTVHVYMLFLWHLIDSDNKLDRYNSTMDL